MIGLTDDQVRALSDAAARGDKKALEELLVHHLPDLRAYVRLRMGPGVRTREGASDLLQSVCREILQGADRFRFSGAGAFKSWLYATALRKLVNKDEFHRAQKRDAQREADVELGAINDVYRRFSSPSQHAMALDELERIERAFATLPDDYREVILLSRVAGLERADVAREMGRSEASIRNLLHRALTQLAQAIDESD